MTQLQIIIGILLIICLILALIPKSRTYTTEEWEAQCVADFKKYGPVPDDPEYKMSDDQFCKTDTAFHGEEVTREKQITYTFTGEELKKYVEFHIQQSLIHTHL